MRTIAELLSMKGRRVLITGAASGIGKAIALRFAEAGSDLLLVDIDEAGLAQTKQAVNYWCSHVLTLAVDLAQKSHIDVFWQHLEVDPPDTLVNNAGSYPMRAYLEVDTRFLEHTLRLNLESALWMCQQFITHRKQQGGVIVNVSSVEALVPLREDLIPYSVSKAGILALTRALAHAYGKQGFRVNVLVPGAIKTPGTEHLARTAIRHLDVDLLRTGYHFQRRLAQGRWGDADEVACAALFLASDLASYIHGIALPVDGGFLAS